jgi:hypothetical protein
VDGFGLEAWGFGGVEEGVVDGFGFGAWGLGDVEEEEEARARGFMVEG